MSRTRSHGATLVVVARRVVANPAGASTKPRMFSSRSSAAETARGLPRSSQLPATSTAMTRGVGVRSSHHRPTPTSATWPASASAFGRSSATIARSVAALAGFCSIMHSSLTESGHSETRHSSDRPPSRCEPTRPRKVAVRAPHSTGQISHNSELSGRSWKDMVGCEPYLSRVQVPARRAARICELCGDFHDSIDHLLSTQFPVFETRAPPVSHHGSRRRRSQRPAAPVRRLTAARPDTIPPRPQARWITCFATTRWAQTCRAWCRQRPSPGTGWLRWNSMTRTRLGSTSSYIDTIVMRSSSPARSSALRVYTVASWACAVAAISRSITLARGCRPTSTTRAARRA